MQYIHFGTGGWRAVIGDDFTKENLSRLGQAVSDMILEDNLNDKPVVIGYDRRFISYDASRWLASVLCANGIKVLLLKRSSPTPLIMHTVKVNDYNFGLEVTASHNPFTYNGVKLFVKEGRDALTDVTTRLEKNVNVLTFDKVKSIDIKEAEKQGLLEYLKNPFNTYLDDILSKIDTQAIRDRGLRIAFDPMHGSGVYAMMVIMFTTRCTADLIHEEKDAFFGAENPAPTPDTLTELRNKVVKGKYDLGIAFDGDGDRLGIIDPSGEYLDANDLIVMFYWYLHEIKHWNGPAVRNNSTTHLLDVMAESFGEKCYETPVGFKWISSKMDEVNAVIGGESSGGLTVRGHIYGKDSTYAASLLIEMLSVTGLTPKQILDNINKKYGHFFITDREIPLSKEIKEAVKKKILTDKLIPDFDNKLIDHVSYEDGCKVYFKDRSFVICRFSGTEPLLRICAEAKCEEVALSYIEAFKKLI